MRVVYLCLCEYVLCKSVHLGLLVLFTIVKSTTTDRAATGHTADDQIEYSVLIHSYPPKPSMTLPPLEYATAGGSDQEGEESYSSFRVQCQ